MPSFCVEKRRHAIAGRRAPRPALARAVIDHFAVGFFNATQRGSPGSKALPTQADADLPGAGQTQVSADPQGGTPPARAGTPVL